MATELHANDTSRQAEPAIWVFRGKSIGFLAIGVLCFIGLFRLFSIWYIDWWIAGVISLMPLGAMTLIVHIFVNGRSPSHLTDWLFLESWKFKTWIYMNACLDKPPCLWVESRKPKHPSLF
jgi:hypothetical protein